MDLYAVTAARFSDGKLLALKMGLVDGATNTWVRQPEEVQVNQVVDELMVGNRVTMIFRREGQDVLGPYLRAVADHQGVENVVPEGEPRAGYTLQDLPRF